MKRRSEKKEGGKKKGKKERSKTHERLKRTLFNWTNQDKMCDFSRSPLFTSYVQHKNRKQTISSLSLCQFLFQRKRFPLVPTKAHSKFCPKLDSATLFHYFMHTRGKSGYSPLRIWTCVILALVVLLSSSTSSSSYRTTFCFVLEERIQIPGFIILFDCFSVNGSRPV